MPDIRHELLIEATSEKIYQALTAQKGLSAWWTPETTAKVELNSVARFAFGPHYYKEMKVLELNPFADVKWLCITGADEWIGTTISFKLETNNAGHFKKVHPEITGQLEQLKNNETATLLIFHHDGWKDYTPMFAECNYTWGQFLRSLKLFCETGKGRPWPEQHRV